LGHFNSETKALIFGSDGKTALARLTFGEKKDVAEHTHTVAGFCRAGHKCLAPATAQWRSDKMMPMRATP
jgi:hypothetical protein